MESVQVGKKKIIFLLSSLIQIYRIIRGPNIFEIKSISFSLNAYSNWLKIVSLIQIYICKQASLCTSDWALIKMLWAKRYISNQESLQDYKCSEWFEVDYKLLPIRWVIADSAGVKWNVCTYQKKCNFIVQLEAAQSSWNMRANSALITQHISIFPIILGYNSYSRKSSDAIKSRCWIIN